MSTSKVLFSTHIIAIRLKNEEGLITVLDVLLIRSRGSILHPGNVPVVGRWHVQRKGTTSFQ
ncbi:hypothetical protein OAH23_15100, partial [Verrucomicrobia bacterium]|nr:hypothetical protein [Verrucomicrobiota bacterium]